MQSGASCAQASGTLGQMSDVRSVNFDRAAEFYDATRDAGDEIVAWTVDLLERELAGSGRALEIGVGTGAIALPLTERGVDLIGMDVSAAMMAKLRQKAGRQALPLLQGDATRIPLRDGSMGAAYARHVLHLVPDWRTVVAELCRVVGAGSVLIDVGGGASDAWLELWDAMQLGPEAEPVGLDVVAEGVEVLDEAFAAEGAELRGVAERSRVQDDTVADWIDEIRRRSPSWTWRVDEADVDRAIEAATAWTLERYGRLDVQLVPESSVRWRIYDVGPR
jgi:SAM-dependent methyltransferase